MKKIVYLDMDGTIADLYGQQAWLQQLELETEGLFLKCEPFITEAILYEYFPVEKYELRICSMTPPNASKKYCQMVIAEKNQWLDKFFPTIQMRIYLPYGLDKNLNDESIYHVLVDDNEKIRKSFKGVAISPPWL